jgi:prophage tail gpP-like protein
MTQVALETRTQSWTGWKSFSLTQTLDNAYQTLSMETTDRFQEGLARWDVEGGTAIRLSFDNNPVFYGYITGYSPKIAEGAHSINLSAKSDLYDLVKSSHVGTIAWRDTTPEEIIQEVLDPFNIPVVFESGMTAIGAEGFRIAANSSPYSIIKRLAERDGLLAVSYRDLAVIVTDNPSFASPPPITLGVWCEISANHDVSKSHSEIILKTQRKSFNNDFDDKQSVEQRVENPSVTRYTPLVILETSDIGQQESFADYVNRRFLGNSVTATVKVKSFFDPNGQLWLVGSRVFVNEPLVDINQELIISSVTFALSESDGISTTLELKVPETYSSNGGTSPAATRRGTGAFGNLLGALI